MFNVGLGRPLNITQLAKIILKVSKKVKKIKYIKKNFSIDNKVKIKINKIKSFGWKPTYSLKDGIEKTINWYKNYYHHE